MPSARRAPFALAADDSNQTAQIPNTGLTDVIRHPYVLQSYGLAEPPGRVPCVMSHDRSKIVAVNVILTFVLFRPPYFNHLLPLACTVSPTVHLGRTTLF